MIKKQISFFIKDTYRGTANDPLSLNLYTYCANNPLIYWDPTGHSYLGKDDYEAMMWYLAEKGSGKSSYQLRKASLADKVVLFGIKAIGDAGNTAIGFVEDRMIDTGVKYGYPPEFVTGRNDLTSEDLERLNKKVFGNQRQIDVIYTMRYTTDEGFRKAVDQDRATNWEVEAMGYVVQEYLYAIPNTILNFQYNRPQRSSDSVFAEYDFGMRLEPYELTHKSPIAYENQRTLKNTAAQMRIGIDGNIELATFGIGKYISASRAGTNFMKGLSAVDDTAKFWDDLARYIDDYKGTKTGVGETVIQSAENAERTGLMQRLSETLRSRKLGYNHEQGRFSYNETLGISRAEKALGRKFQPSDTIGVDIVDPNGLGNISLKGPFLNAQKQPLTQVQQQAVIKNLQKHISTNTAVDVHIIDTLGLSNDVINALQDGLSNSPVKVIYIK